MAAIQRLDARWPRGDRFVVEDMTAPEALKCCTGCHAVLPFDAFGPQKSGRNGLRPDCKGCRCARQAKYHTKNTGFWRLQHFHARSLLLEKAPPTSSWFPSLRERLHVRSNRFEGGIVANLLTDWQSARTFSRTLAWLAGVRMHTGWHAALFFLLFVACRASACTAPPKAIVDISGNDYYQDAHHSVIDAARFARNQAAMQSLRSFRHAVAAYASRYASDPQTNAPAGACAVAWLVSWAEHGAMLGSLATHQSIYERTWDLASLAVGYARVQSAATTEQDATIKTWLSEVAERVLRFSRASNEPRNNHYYWDALAVGAVAKLTNNEGEVLWAKDVFAYAMNQLQPNGTLPYEMARNTRALHYQNFAAAPLVYLSAMFGIESSKLRQMIDLNVRGLEDPSLFKMMTGDEQTAPAGGDAAYLKVYARHHNDPAVSQFLMTHMVGSDDFLGDVSIESPLEAPRSPPPE
jgi:poly(beta-D-mannuronate) lyase